MNLAGLPPTTVHGSTSLNTFEQAATTLPVPIVTPLPIVDLVAIQQSSWITIGAVTISKLREYILWDPLNKSTPLEIQQRLPIFTCPRHLMQQSSSMLDNDPIVRFHGSTILALRLMEQAQSIFAPNIFNIATLVLLIKKGVHLNNVELIKSHTRDLILYPTPKGVV